MFVEVSSEMNDGVVFLHTFDRLLVANVKSGTPGKILGCEILPDKRAEITTATGNQNLHIVFASIARDSARPRARAFSRANDSALPIAISMSPLSIFVSPLGLKIISPSARRILTTTMFSSDRITV